LPPPVALPFGFFCPDTAARVVLSRSGVKDHGRIYMIF
jgi:hypothetical protein